MPLPCMVFERGARYDARCVGTGRKLAKMVSPTRMSSETTTLLLYEKVRELGILPPGEAASRAAEGTAAVYPDPRDAVEEWKRREILTPFQAELLLDRGADDLVLGPYVLLECLGEGGMGRVYKARHRLMNRIVALKVIREELAAREEFRKRFHREIQAAAQVSHPNIVIAFDAALIQDVPVLVMEYVDGQSLSRMIKTGPLSIRQAAEFARQVAIGLEHVREQGLVHRDVKPSNLLVASRDSIVKILDLGLARLDELRDRHFGTGELTPAGAIVGTPDYMSPEQAIQPQSADIRSDIYSLGCTLYQMLSGLPPFPEGNVTQKLLWHQQKEPPPIHRSRAGIPAGLAEVLSKMMAKEPRHRFQTPREVAEALSVYSSSKAPLLHVSEPTTPPFETFESPGPGGSGMIRYEPTGEGSYDLADEADTLISISEGLHVTEVIHDPPVIERPRRPAPPEKSTDRRGKTPPPLPIAASTPSRSASRKPADRSDRKTILLAAIITGTIALLAWGLIASL